MKNKNAISKNFYYLYGKHPVYAALKNPQRHVEHVLCTQEMFNTNMSLISACPYDIVTAQHLTKLLGINSVHQGIAAKVKTIFTNNIKDINVQNPHCKIAILDQITDPQNIGAIIRSAASFDINTIIMPRDNTPDENAVIAKAASGALEYVQILQVTNLRSTMNYLKKHGFWIVGLSGHAKDILDHKLLSNKVAVVLGSEDKGIRKLICDTCDYLVRIAVSNAVESLNVSNAAAIAFSMMYSQK